MSNRRDPAPLKNHIAEAIKVVKNSPEELQAKEAGEEYINIKERQRSDEKRRIAQHIAFKYVNNLDAVAIDAGSTLQLIVEQMMGTKQFLSILTNNMTAFRRDSKRRIPESANEFILTGGKYVALFDALLGNETYNSFDLFNPNVVIIGVSGLIPAKGFFCHGNDEKNVKELLFKKKDCTIIIPADHSKLGKSDSYLFGKTSEFKDLPGTQCVVVTAAPNPKDDESTDPEVHSQALRAYEDHKAALKAQGIIVDEIAPQ